MDGISKSKRRQICIKDEEMADEIGSPSNIVGIVFLNDAQ
jgi:hypothetical protein